MNKVNASRGTYIVVLKSHSQLSVSIGKLGNLEVYSGYYFYVGSAFGPGGVKARLKHHANIAKSPHWHIDYLKKVTEFVNAYYVIDEQRYEHEWASLLNNASEYIQPMKGFGSSDCKCSSHLYYSEDNDIKNLLQQHYSDKTIQVYL